MRELVTYEIDEDYGYVITYVNGIPISYTRHQKSLLAAIQERDERAEVR